jgi:hypothetical protein
MSEPCVKVQRQEKSPAGEPTGLGSLGRGCLKGTSDMFDGTVLCKCEKDKLDCTKRNDQSSYLHKALFYSFFTALARRRFLLQRTKHADLCTCSATGYEGS